jgi:hypothetical protein
MLLAMICVAACHCEEHHREVPDAIVNEVNLLQDEENIVTRSGIADASNAADDDGSMTTWARSRLPEMQDEPDWDTGRSPSAPSSDRHNLDFHSILSPESDSFSSPEDIRNLFYSDSARAESDALSGDFAAAATKCRNLLRVKPDYAHCHYVTGMMLWKQYGRWASALRSLTRWVHC